MSSILHVKLEMVVIQAWQKNIMSLSQRGPVWMILDSRLFGLKLKLLDKIISKAYVVK